MTAYTNNCEGSAGTVDGTDVATTNAAASSTNWTSIVRGTSAVVDYSNTHSLVGNFGIRYASTTVNADRATTTWNWSATPTNRLVARFYAYLTPSAGATCAIWAAQGALSARIANVAISTSGFVNLSDFGTGTGGSAAPLAWNTWYRFEILLDQTVSPQVFTVKIYDGHSTTSIETVQITSGAPDLGTAGTILQVVHGKYGQTSTLEWWADEIALTTDSVTPIGPASGAGIASYVLTSNYAANTSSPITSFKVDATGSTGVTTLVQTAGTTVTITQSPTGVFTFPNPAGTDNLVFTLTATSGGASTKTITIPRQAVAAGKPFRWTLQATPATSMSNWK